jgi:hypothetical protein
MPRDISEHLINIYLSNLNSSSGNLGTVSCYLKYLKCVRFLKFATRNVIRDFSFQDIRVQVQIFSSSIFGFGFYAWSE